MTRKQSTRTRPSRGKDTSDDHFNEAMAVDHRVGERLKSLRTFKGLTSREVAERAGITRTHLSRIENAHISPTVSTLSRIAWAIGEPIWRVFGDEGQGHPVVRKKNRRVIHNRGVTDYLLTPQQAKQLEVFETIVEAGAESGSDAYSHPADEECIVVLTGQLTLWVSEERYDMRKGDSITFSGRTPHRFVNEGRTPSSLIWIVTPAGGY